MALWGKTGKLDLTSAKGLMQRRRARLLTANAPSLKSHAPVAVTGGRKTLSKREGERSHSSI